MTRLQILELPEGSGDDRPPFVLVVDQAPSDGVWLEAFRRDLEANDIANRIGARAVLCFEDTIEIPANDNTAYLSPAPDAHIDLEIRQPRQLTEEEVHYLQDGIPGRQGG